jgi:hypothetical protein
MQMPAPIDNAEEAICRAAGPIRSELEAEYLRRSHLVAAAKGLDEAQTRAIFHSTPIKYAIDPPRFLRRFREYLPWLAGIGSLFEIGVGPGFLFHILRTAYGAQITGVDVDFSREWVYRDFRRALMIDHLVAERPVVSGEAIPIPPGAEAVIGFFTVFNEHWGVSDHQWFLDECAAKLSGKRLVILRFNPKGFDDAPEVRTWYRLRGDFPLASDPNFCIVSL